ncbi:GspE/PulE family protein [Candidatus Gracilibacteria bacterium]|nr:GspE/PulE family protein [Candidatus Gracilibacteria bacterium]
MGQNNFTFLGNINREFEEREVEKRARSLGIGYVNLSRFPPNPDALKIIPEEDARTALLFPLEKNGKELSIALADPDKPETKVKIQELENQFQVSLFLASRLGLDQAYEAYKSDFLHKKSVQKKVLFEERSEENLKSKIASLTELKEKINTLPAATALSEIEMSAVHSNASDIHFQPQEQGVTLRFRVDGILHNIFDIVPAQAKKLITRIKYEAGMRSNVSTLPQDGHISFSANNRKIDLRISTLPTPFGESIVMRLLDAERGIQSFTDLGFSEHVRDCILLALREKTGLILVTGPTGSGKTTTLYSMLAELNLPDRKLVTLEDPIEYQLPGVSQSQVDEEKEYNFDNGLAALLRHDPDIILVGEIRTRTTAHLAAEAALTGHGVLSSLHTNSAIGAISRLRNLGLENFNMAPALTAIFAQRLVRNVCTCATEVPLPNDAKFRAAFERVKKIRPEFETKTTILRAKGCEKCSDTGYIGRMAICEAFLVTDEIRKMILEQKSEQEISHFLNTKSDFLTLFEDGVLKILEERTTLEELYRVTS